MSANPYVAKPILTPRDAIASHVRWKITLLLATSRREPLSPRAARSIEHSEECAIGKWLLSQHTQSLRSTPEYRLVFSLHESWHVLMRRIAALIHAGEYDEAERVVNAPEPFQSASSAFANALMALDRLPPAKPAS